MIRVLCAMLVLAIENLEVYLDNSNLPLRISTIQFELLAQKKETSK